MGNEDGGWTSHKIEKDHESVYNLVAILDAGYPIDVC